MVNMGCLELLFLFDATGLDEKQTAVLESEPLFRKYIAPRVHAGLTAAHRVQSYKTSSFFWRKKESKRLRGCSDTHKAALKFVVCILFPSIKVVTHASTVLVSAASARACAHSQVVRLPVEGGVVQVRVEVRVVLGAHPADGRAVEGGARAHVRLQAGHRLRLLGARMDFWDLKGQKLGRFVVAAEGQRRPGGGESGGGGSGGPAQPCVILGDPTPPCHV